MKSKSGRIFWQDPKNTIHKGKDRFSYYVKLRTGSIQRQLQKSENPNYRVRDDTRDTYLPHVYIQNI